MQRVTVTALLSLTFLAMAQPPETQVTAKQGVSPEPEIVRFNSPMILELPLANLGTLEPGTRRKLPGVRKYLCDNDVSFTTLYIEKEFRGRKKARELTLVITGSIFVADSYDRLSDLAIRVKSRDRVIATHVTRGISTEEERTTPFRLVVPITEAALSEALAAEQDPVLELTLTVRDNS
jgi:hypothetical protein